MTSWPQFPHSIDALRFWGRLAPHRTALVERVRDSRQSYADLDAAADRWGSVLRSNRVGQGDKVAVVSGNRREVAELFFACCRVGAALVPLNWRLAPVELGAIIAHSQPVLLVGEGRFRAALEEATQSTTFGNDWIDLDDDAPRLLQKAEQFSNDAENKADDAALLLYTSGSTGQPKGVIIPHRQMVRPAAG